ncbi:MAG: phosphate signaling complex protein PhoU [Nannocystaceae bacterium]
MTKPIEHTARTYEQELAALRQSLLLMAGRVEEMIARSGRALADRDAEFARRTIELDGAVNRAEVDIDEMCMLILAKRQPMASDLRFVTLAMKMVTDLERIADLAVNICERAIDLSRGNPVVVHRDVPRMSAVVESMVKDAIDAFVSGSASKAREVISRDDEVDELYHRVFGELLESMRADPATMHEIIHVQSVAKWLERIADHSTNIAELVIYMVEGRDVRHPGKRGTG